MMIWKSVMFHNILFFQMVYQRFWMCDSCQNDNVPHGIKTQIPGRLRDRCQRFIAEPREEEMLVRFHM